MSQDTPITAPPIRPVGYRIVIEPTKPEEISKGGIIIAKESQDIHEAYTYIGKVVAVGKGCYNHPKFDNEVWCKPGDYVAHGRYAGQKLEVKDGKGGYLIYRILNDDEVLGVIDDPNQFRIYL
jgi:co-chaperonin GroES (HSP10)